jgi:hypothetical protein
MLKKHITTILGLVLLLVPMHVGALSWDVQSEDAIAGFGTEIRVIGAPAKNITISIQRPNERDIDLSEVTDGRGESTVELRPREAERAGEYNVIVRDRDGQKLAATMFEVFPDVPALLMLDPEDDVLMQGEATTIMIGIFDRFDNPLPNRPVILVSSDGEVKKFDDQTGKDGRAEFSFTPDRDGEVAILAVDVLSNKSQRFTLDVEPAPSRKNSSRLSASLLDEYEEEEKKSDRSTQRYGFIDHFDVEVDSTEPVLKINAPYTFSIIARDRNNRRVDDYVGSVIIETTDPLAEVPQNAVKFRASDRGRIDLSLALMFGTPGKHTIFVRGKEDDDIRGLLENVWVVGHSATPNAGRIIVESYGKSQTVPSRHVTVSGKAPVYIGLDLFANENLLASGSSDENGRFSFSVTLDAVQTVHEMIVRESDGGLDRVSDPFTLTVDDAAPEIVDFLLIPPSVVSGESFKVRLTTDAGESVLVGVGDVSLVSVPETAKNPDGTSVYEASLVAPAEAGQHTVTVIIRDRAGNEVQQSKILTVLRSGIAPVQNLRASADGEDIILSWMAVAGAVQYRVYWGLSPINLTSQIDTGSAATSARLTGLQSGVTYFFAITAIDGSGAESAMSESSSVATRGSLFSLQALPRINGVHLQWTALPGSSIVGYLVQYGVQSGMYSEQRTAGTVQTELDLTDLINGIPYYIKLSAVQPNGQLITDRVEVTVIAGHNGQPGLYLSPIDALPGSVGGPPTHSAPRPSGSGIHAPSVPGTGLPLFAWVSILLFVVVGYTGARVYRQRLQEKNILAHIAHQIHNSH